jgi:hypothetical protein
MFRVHVHLVAIALAVTTVGASSDAFGECECVGDLNTDGTTNGADLAVLLGAWGDSGPGDLDVSGLVDGADLAILLGSWGPCAAPTNDHCNSAANIAWFDETTPFCTAAATSSAPGTSCGSAVMGKDVWYRYSPAYEGILYIDTFGSSFDTMLSVYYQPAISNRCGCPGVHDVEVIACDDDASPGTLQSEVVVPVEEGNFGLPCFTLRVGGFTNGASVAAGSGVLNTYLVRKGDRCDVPHQLPSVLHQSKAGHNGSDTWLEPDQSSCATNDVQDEWYRFEMPCDGTITISTCNATTTFDTTLAVFSGCGSAQLACNDDSSDPGCQIAGLNRKSKLTVVRAAGDVILIRVSGFNNSTGPFALDVDVSCVE